jgi:hypothetical protein
MKQEKADITKIYQETSTALRDIFQKRRRTQILQKWVWGITGIFFVFMLLGLLAYNLPYFVSELPELQLRPEYRLYPLIGCVVLLTFSSYFFTAAFQKFKLAETQTMAKMVKRLFPQVAFTQQIKAPEAQAVDSKLFPWIKEDSALYCYGKIRSRTQTTEINITDLGMVEANLSNRFLAGLIHIPILNLLVVLYQQVFKQMVAQNSAETVNFTFRGMFCWFRFKKKLNGHTVVLPNTPGTKLDRWGSFNFTEEERIYLEDPRFNDKFVVYATNQVEARYVLSSAFMERILELLEKFDRQVYLSFQDRKLYLAVANANGLFSFPAGQLDRVETVQDLAHDIQ